MNTGIALRMSSLILQWQVIRKHILVWSYPPSRKSHHIPSGESRWFQFVIAFIYIVNQFAVWAWKIKKNKRSFYTILTADQCISKLVCADHYDMHVMYVISQTRSIYCARFIQPFSYLTKGPASGIVHHSHQWYYWCPLTATCRGAENGPMPVGPLYFVKSDHLQLYWRR